MPTSSPTAEKQIYQGVVRPAGFPELPAGWASDWETFLSSDNQVQLFGVMHARAQAPTQANRPARVLVVSHGIGEHGGRYLHLPHFLQDAVDAVYCLDHRGHGRSEGTRGHVDRWELFGDDLAVAIRRAHEKGKRRFGEGVEVHVLGHSMGGLIALGALWRHADLPVKSLILSAPLFGIKVQVPAVKRLAATVLARTWGSLQMVSELDPSHLSHDPAVIEAYLGDRLVHKKITPRLFTEMVAAMEEMQKRENGFGFPLLLLDPGEDQITDSGAARAFFEKLQHANKQLKTYPGFRHEVLNEIGKEKVFEDIKAWISHST